MVLAYSKPTGLEWASTEDLMTELQRRMQHMSYWSDITSPVYRCGTCGNPFDGQIHYCTGRPTSSGV